MSLLVESYLQLVTLITVCDFIPLQHFFCFLSCFLLSSSSALSNLQVFSERYVASNPKGISQNVDTILLLSFAMAMLNTDLHNGNVKRKMNVEDFIRNLRGIGFRFCGICYMKPLQIHMQF